MGKKSLIKSTTKKKAKKTAKAKRANSDSGSNDKTLSVKDLIFKKFERHTPNELVIVKKEEADPDDTFAPPFFSATDEKDAARIRNLLFLKYDPKDLIEAATEMPKESVPEKEPPSIQSLIFKKYERHTPKELFLPEPKFENQYSYIAPPFFIAKDKADENRLKNLLMLKFSPEKLIEAAADKAAADKAAADKAAADKAAADKAAADKAAAQQHLNMENKMAEPRVTVQNKTNTEQNSFNSIIKTTIVCAAGLALFILMIVWTSYSNSQKYYIEESNGIINVSKGRFAPTGKSLFISLTDAELPKEKKFVYTKEDIFPLLFTYYLKQADKPLASKEFPDFKLIQEKTKTAKKYAQTPANQTIAETRLKMIEKSFLLYKADISLHQGTKKGLQEGIDYLKQAVRLTTDNHQKEALLNRIKDAEASLKKSKETIKKILPKKSSAPTPKTPEKSH